MTDIGERRAKFVYEAARLENIAAGRPINPEPWESRDEKFRANMIRVVARVCNGWVASPRKLHESWVRAYRRMGWRHGKVRDVEKKTHPDMVAFHRLGRLEQEKDWVFFALCKIARRMK